MPRSARVKSETGIYHVMLRGINQTQLFYDDEDRIAFMDRLKRYRDECGFSLYAYCLMGNHVHILLNENEWELSLIIKRIALSYSFWFNSKYDRNGYLFQGRYKREAVTSDKYLLTVVRYIHNNPVQVGEPITLWTSHDEYMNSPRIVDTSLVMGMFDDDPARARKQFSDFSGSAPEAAEAVLGEQSPAKLKDAQAIQLIEQIANVTSCQDLINAEKDERNRVLTLLKENGLSVRQIARLTGINRNIIQRVGKL